MTTDNEPHISVASPESDRPADRTLTLTFAPDAPLAMVRVDADPVLAGVSDRVLTHVSSPQGARSIAARAPARSSHLVALC